LARRSSAYGRSATGSFETQAGSGSDISQEFPEPLARAVVQAATVVITMRYGDDRPPEAGAPRGAPASACKTRTEEITSTTAGISRLS